MQRCSTLDISRIRDHRGRCVMHYAAQKGNVAALEYFGPLANALCCEGWSPLHYAAYFGNRITCERLIQLGADIDLPCEAYGRTAYDYAADGEMKCTKIALALAGADSEKARKVAHDYIESLSGAYRKKMRMSQLHDTGNYYDKFAPAAPSTAQATSSATTTNQQSEGLKKIRDVACDKMVESNKLNPEITAEKIKAADGVCATCAAGLLELKTNKGSLFGCNFGDNCVRDPGGHPKTKKWLADNVDPSRMSSWMSLIDIFVDDN